MRSKPISVTVNGVSMCLNTYLLQMPNRLLPKSPTHYLVVDILNKDLSIKRVTIYFNPLDPWTNPSSNFAQNTSKSVGLFIGENLSFLGRDPNTTAYPFWVMEVASNTLVHSGHMYDYCDWDAA